MPLARIKRTHRCSLSLSHIADFSFPLAALALVPLSLFCRRDRRALLSDSWALASPRVFIKQRYFISTAIDSGARFTAASTKPNVLFVCVCVLTHPTPQHFLAATKECERAGWEKEGARKKYYWSSRKILVRKGLWEECRDAPGSDYYLSENKLRARDDLILVKLKSTGVKIIAGVPFPRTIYCLLGDNDIFARGRLSCPC